VLLYGCEIWGQAPGNKIKLQPNNEYTLDLLYPKQRAEKLQLKYYKFLLGVNKSCADDAVYGELGKQPIYIDILLHIAKYWHRLQHIPENMLLYDAHLCDKDLHKNGTDSINLLMQQTLNQLNLSHLFSNPMEMTTNIFGRIVKKRLHEKQSCQWGKSLFDDKKKVGSGGKKLRTYRLFKNTLNMEPYLLHVKNRDDRRRLCQLRTSSHKLNIEAGRYQQIPEQNRIYA
jgi:hypothetical protein